MSLSTCSDLSGAPEGAPMGHAVYCVALQSPEVLMFRLLVVILSFDLI